MEDLLAGIFGLAFILIGIEHFRNPQKFVEITPNFLPFPLMLVFIAGGMEIAGGVAIIYPETRIIAGRFLALFLIGIYPANLYMWTHNIKFNGTEFTTSQHVLRLMAQLLLIAVALYLSGDLDFGNNSA